jgi:hypothetical protein
MDSTIRKGKLAFLGLGLACGLLIYDNINLYSYFHKLKKDPVMKEFYLAVKNNDIEKAKELQTRVDEVQKYTPEMRDKLKKGKDINKIALGVTGLSTLYLLGANGLYILKENKKRKSLEKELTSPTDEVNDRLFQNL